jgi:hypothetical protein
MLKKEFLGAFAKLQKKKKKRNFVRSLRPSVHLHGRIRLPLDDFS